MAAGWPVKTTYLNGDVYSGTDVNDANGTLNYINPTSATDLQVLTRDNASPGKVKWANSPANIATTTGDILYASSANTLTRLGIGATNSVLTVAGGVPTWAASAGGLSLISTQTATSGTTVSFSSIPSGFTHLMAVGSVASTGANQIMTLTINGLGAGYTGRVVYDNGTNIVSGGTGTASWASTSNMGSATQGFGFNYNFPNYSNTTLQKYYNGVINSLANTIPYVIGGNNTTTSAISSMIFSFPAITYVKISLYGMA